jgi:hypothetical protein
VLIVHLAHRVHSSFRVTATERIRVRRHREHFSFTRVYRSC